MTLASLRTAVIGAGIGGLTAALALRQAGFGVDVYEQAPELTEVGGGINLAPNATRILRQLGLAAGLDREGVHQNASQMTPNRQILVDFPRYQRKQKT
jgi:salicylate hydroxylase